LNAGLLAAFARKYAVFQWFYRATPISQFFAHQGAERFRALLAYLFLKHFFDLAHYALGSTIPPR
jgi:hypothetical protein